MKRQLRIDERSKERVKENRFGVPRPVVLLLIILSANQTGERTMAASPASRKSSPIIHQQQVGFDIPLVDPVAPAHPPQTHRVLQFRDSQGYPSGYALRVVTEVCTDNKCKLVDLTLYWNVAGHYERMEWRPATPLTKKEHVPFTLEDYARLDGILKDADSPLAGRSLAFLGSSEKDDRAVDAVAGATPESVKDAVVQDAAYTTWVMWHWANGSITQQLQLLTAQDCTPVYLDRLLRSAHRSIVEFALRQVENHYRTDGQFVDAVIAALSRLDGDLFARGLRYVLAAATDRSRTQLQVIAAFGQWQEGSVRTALDLLARDDALLPSTGEALAAAAGRVPYFQVHLILQFLERKSFTSDKAETDVVRLLESDNFFIARRACEHLLKLRCSPETARRIHDFKALNQSRF